MYNILCTCMHVFMFDFWQLVYPGLCVTRLSVCSDPDHQGHLSERGLDDGRNYSHYHRRQLLWRATGRLWHNACLEWGENNIIILCLNHLNVVFNDWTICKSWIYYKIEKKNNVDSVISKITLIVGCSLCHLKKIQAHDCDRWTTQSMTKSVGYF